ncbi:FRIGIDA-like protein 5 isoform X2 [Argentina anserina]|uniref:FRIGIDA-like protein 5 isoform X2 n=1 Tax=Argentina anserina TaxID=57926 RepID=UPI0021768CFD|nr:FRIGIDA-like protein 5 isoform X2 [Potentilla anserina]
MENSIASDLELAETKQSNLGRVYDILNAQASSFTVLGPQWKDLEDHLDSTRAKLQTRFQELLAREAQIGKVESLEEDKAKRLREVVRKKQKELECCESHLSSVKVLIEENNEELEVKERRFEEIERLLKERERGLGERRERLRVLDCRVEKMEREVRRVQGVLDKYCVDVKRRRKECVSREKEVKEMKREIERCDKDLRLKWGEMEAIQEAVLAYSERIRVKEEVIREMEVKVEEFGVVKKEMKEWCCSVEVKKREMEEWVERVEKRERGLGKRAEEIDLIEKRVNECLSEGQLKLERDFHAVEELRQENVRHFELLEKSVQERLHEVEVRERRMEEKAKELELKEKQLDSIPKVNGEKMKLKGKGSIIHPLVKVQPLEHDPANNVFVPSNASNARGLQSIMSEHLKRIDLMSREMTALLQASTDPAALVLDAMEGFYPTNSTVNSKELDSDLRVIRRSCIVLLQELKRFSPLINAQIREKAMKLACKWKAKLMATIEDRLEVLGFLWLVTTYKLMSMYDLKELQSLLSIVVQPGQATDLFQALGVSDMTYVIIEELDSSVVECADPFSSPNLQLNATKESTKFQGFIVERLSENNSIHEKMLATLQVTSDPAQSVLEMIKSSFGQCWRERGFCSELTVMKSYVYLLETLMRVSKHIRPHVKEDARKLAVQWKARMRADAGNSLEILLFLQFIATYELLSTIDGGDIVNLLGVISRHRQALELCQTVGFADKIPGFIQNLIERKQLIGAVRCICSFKLIDKFPAVQLLKDHVDDARKHAREICINKLSFSETEKVVDGLVGDLRAVHQCIKDYNLESEFPSGDIEVEVVQLGRLKEHYRSLAPSLASTVDQQDQRKRKRVKRPNTSTSAPFFIPQQLEQSNHQNAVSTAIPYALPISTSIYSESSSSSRLYANYGLPGQFGMAANDHANVENTEVGLMLSLKGQYLSHSRNPVAVHSADHHYSNIVILE